MGLDNNRLEKVTIFIRPNWGAIWAGVFAFIAIWAGLGAFALVVFRRFTNFSGLLAPGIELGACALVLSVIGMFFAGSITGWLTGNRNGHDRVLHGIVMFCFALVSALIMLFLSGASGGATTIGFAHRIDLLDIFSYPGWPLLCGVVLGWLAAIAGAATARGGVPAHVILREIHGP